MKPDATAPRGTRLTDEELVTLWLARRIEAMGERAAMYSRSAYTHRGTHHVAFANGAVRVEGEAAANDGATADVFDLAEATLAAVREYRRGIEGPVVLVWRCEPEVTRENGSARIYLRLCFEPDPMAQALAA
jgi:hypothetical protein